MCGAPPVYRFPSFSFCCCARLPLPVPCAPVRLSHCAMRGLTHTLTWVPMRSLSALWSSLLPLVIIFSMHAPPGGAVAEVNSQGAGVLLVKISSVLNPEARDAAGACCAGPGKVRWDISGKQIKSGHSYFPIFLTTDSARVSARVLVSPCCVCVPPRRQKIQGGILKMWIHGMFNILGLMNSFPSGGQHHC